MQNVSVIITDIDNTLYDWVEMWYQSFSMLFNRLVMESGIDSATLEAEIKAIFHKHRALEHRFLIHELSTLKTHPPTQDMFKEPLPLMVAYRKACESALYPYPSVLETLKRLKDRGCLIIAFTGSRAYYAAQRVKVLGLDGLFDYVYSPQDHDLPPGITQEETCHYAAEPYILQHSIQRPLARDTGKPDPEALLTIIKHVDAQIDQVIYIGDSLTRDIIMAQHAHVTDVHAEYGRVQPTLAYEFLRRFSHWTGEDFKREGALNERNAIYPAYVLKHSLGELMTLFDFIPYSRR